MPLPDAKPDRRIYELLKTTDLENLTFSQFQGVAEKIYAEQGAEDELRRIVLVNLARLAVVGEWTGLTTAASGGDPLYATAPIERFTGSSGDLNMRIPAQALGALIVNWNLPVGCYLMPFIASDDATIDAIQLYAATTNGTATEIGVYTTDTEGLPDTLQVSGSITTSSTGVLTQTSLTGSLTMTKGTNYWLAWISDHASQQYACIRYSETTPTSPLPGSVVYTGYTENVLFDASVSTLPSSLTMSGFDPVNASVPLLGLRLA